MQVKPVCVIADFKGKNYDFKTYLAKNKPADGFRDILKDAMKGDATCKSAGTP